jgi:hypothetical protein
MRRLDRLVGSWTMEGNLIGAEEKNIKGETTKRFVGGICARSTGCGEAARSVARVRAEAFRHGTVTGSPTRLKSQREA